MHSPIVLTIFWIIGTAAQVLIVALLIWRKLIRQWPSVFAYCIVALLFDVAIHANKGIYKRYFYLYWTWAFVGAVMRFWVLGDVVRSFPGGGFIATRIRLCIAGFGAAVAIGAAWITWLDPISFGTKVVHTAVLADRCLAYSSAAFLAVSMLAIWAMRLGWSRTGVFIANGLIVRAVAGIITASLSSFATHSGQVAGTYILSGLSAAALFFWLQGIATHKDETYTFKLTEN